MGVSRKGVKFAVLASGRGSNFAAIARAVKAGSLNAEPVAVISDRADAKVLELAREAGLPAIHVGPPAREAGDLATRRRLHDEAMLEALRPYSPRFLVFAGYMRIVTPALIEAFRSERGYSRIVNVHPSLLPAFPGVNSYTQAYEYGVKVTGATVHLVDDGVDQGPVCAQRSFAIDDCRAAVDVEKKGLEIEHRLYPETLEWVLPERFEVETRGGRICVLKS